MRIDPNKFWQQPESWPLDTSGYVFLGRAVLRVAAAQVVPPEPITFPLSTRAKLTYDVATERIVKAAAKGKLRTAVLAGSRMFPMMPSEWVTLDREAIFKRLHLTEAPAYVPSSYREVGSPIYVEGNSLSSFVGWTALLAKGAKADAAFAQVKACRYRFEDQPDLLPPAGFISMNEALSRFSQDGLGPVASAKELRRKLYSGEAEAVLQFWESGAVVPFHASDWSTPETRLAFTDNGTVAIPDVHGRDGAYSSWAYVRVKLNRQPAETVGAPEVKPAPDSLPPVSTIPNQTPPGDRGAKRRNVEAALMAEFGPSMGRNERDRRRAMDAVVRWRKANPSERLPDDEGCRRAFTRIWGGK